MLKFEKNLNIIYYTAVNLVNIKKLKFKKKKIGISKTITFFGFLFNLVLCAN